VFLLFDVSSHVVLPVADMLRWCPAIFRLIGGADLETLDNQNLACVDHVLAEETSD
jgi:hypothetical protein